jgi:hypothetical protein
MGGRKPKNRNNNKNKGAARKTQASTSERSQEDSLEVEDWTDIRKHTVRQCTFSIDDSTKLDRKEKDRVKNLMREYVVKDPIEVEKHKHELAVLLDKAFVAKFDIKILNDFTAARKINFDLFSLQTFTAFASWWENVEVEPPSGSPERFVSPVEVVPRENFISRVKKMVSAFLQGGSE